MSAGVTRLLGIELPIVLGAFGGLSSVDLTAAVSAGGGLGSYGLYGYEPDRIRSTVASLRAATDRPFALNLWLPLGTEREPDAEEFDAARTALAGFFDELGLPLPEPPERYLPSFEEQIEAVLELAPAAVSFVYGVPPAHVVVRAREQGVVVIGTATTVDEAVALQDGGVDAVIATGAEAAGHRVSFLRDADASLVGTFALVPQVADAVTIPVIASGGAGGARHVAEALEIAQAALLASIVHESPARLGLLREELRGLGVPLRDAA